MARWEVMTERERGEGGCALCSGVREKKVGMSWPPELASEAYQEPCVEHKAHLTSPPSIHIFHAMALCTLLTDQEGQT